VFKAIELDAGSRQRTGRALVLDADSRQSAVDALLAQLQVPPAFAVVDPTRTMVRIGEQLWTIVRGTSSEERGLSGSQRRAGAKHKQVR
jgi:hypothetical protein